MFEGLAGKVLSRLLSKYFVVTSGESSSTSSVPAASNSSNGNSSNNSWTGVWSGSVSFENLTLKRELANEVLRSKGIPLELLSCTIQKVELTIPWAKDDDVVLVLDGVHVLLRDCMVHDDAALRRELVKHRRRALLQSQVFGANATSASSSTSASSTSASASYAEVLKKRVTEGILKDILDKLHVHLRNLHVRMEHVDETTPMFAMGLTLESLHVHHEQERIDRAVVRKVAQLHHLAVYWNPLDYGTADIGPELSVLQALPPSQSIARALDKCIARRSPLQNAPPKHAYVLCPVDATAHVSLSTTPNDWSIRPALEITVDLDDVSMQLRDFQVASIRQFQSSLKEHAFATPYRAFRPTVSASVDPKAWWVYAVRILRMELQRSRMRWSWSRFHSRFQERRRYCALYERQQMMMMPHSTAPMNGSKSGAENGKEGNDIEPTNTNDSMGRCNSTDSFQRMVPLTESESMELADMEDGIRAELSVHDIVLYRALIKARLKNMAASSEHAPQLLPKVSTLRRLVSSIIPADMESEEEYEHLLAYLEQANKTYTDSQNEDLSLRSLVAISIQANLGRGCMTFFAPLSSTADLHQHRRIHERFLDLSIVRLHVGYSLLGNFKAFELQSSLDTLSIKEVRSNKKEYTVLSRLHNNPNADLLPPKPLIFVEIISDPPDHPEYDVGVHAQIEAILISLSSSCEWLHRGKRLFGSSLSSKSKKSFWEGLSMASSSSRRADVVAKMESALSKHKNLDLDILVKMPTISVDDSNDKVMSIDLGEASMVTERLAGVSTGKLNLRESRRKASLDENERNRASTPVEDDRSGSLGEIPSPRLTPRMDGLSFRLNSSPRSRGLDTFFLGKSSQSILLVDGDKRPVLGRGVSINENMYVSTIDQTDDMTNVSTVNSYQSSFYDVFNLRLSRPRLSLIHDGENDTSDLLTQLEIKVVFEVSVLPADHTLCRLITSCMIEEIGVSCSTTDIDTILMIFRSWKSALSGLEPTASSPAVAYERNFNSGDQISLSPYLNSIQRNLESASDSSSVLNEAEFIDALDGGDSEGNNDWFDENFVVDTESTVASESRSILRGTQRRRSRSMSDTSSISDLSNIQPQRKLHRNDGAYLSAENLAKLDENGGEDHSDAESEDSFHSAVHSLQDRHELLDAIKHDIDRVRDQVWKLKRKLSESTTAPVSSYNLTAIESSKRRNLRQSIKLDIDRAEADLKALHASRQDLLIALPETNDLVSSQEQAAMSPPQRQQKKDPVIERANSVLRSRRKRVSIMDDDGFVHNLTNKLNREIFRGSFQVKRLSLQFSRLPSFGDQYVSLDTSISKLSLGSTHRSNDTKMFASIDSVQIMSWVDSFEERKIVFTGGDDYTLTHTNLPSEFPQLLSSSTNDEKFMRLALHNKGKRSGGKSRKSRLLVGGIEMVPRIEVTYALACLKARFSGPKGKKSGIDLDAPWQKLCRKLLGKTTTELQTRETDFILRFSSVRCRFMEGSETVGAFAASEVGVRVARSVKNASITSRCQLDLRCTNIQVLEIKSTGSSAVEILGRRDAFGHLLFARIRVQTVPCDHAGGWVVGGHDEADMQIQNCVNCHVGARCNALQIVASRVGFKSMKDTITLHGRSSMNDCPTPMKSNVAKEIFSDATLPAPSSVRWRADFSANNVVIVLPAKSYHQLALPISADSNILLGLSVQACAQRHSTEANSLDVHFITKDLYLTRTADDWPILEKTTLCASFVFPKTLQAHAVAPYQLLLPKDSAWMQEESVTLRLPDVAGDASCVRASIFSRPLRINLSTQIYSLLISNFEGLKHRETKGVSETPRRESRRLSEFDARVVLEQVEVRLLRQSQNSTSIALADRVASAQLKTCSFSTKVRLREAVAHFDVSQAAVFDLSSLPGVRIVGSSPLGDRGEIDFLRVSVGRSNLLSGQKTTQVNLRWGDVQIIPIPSFVESLIQFKAELEEIRGPRVPLESDDASSFAPASAQDIFVVFSFEVQNFECVLSSRSILAYLRDKSKEPIHVVSFRWASSTKGFVLLKHELSEGAVMTYESALVGVDNLLTKATHDFETLCDFGHRCLQRFTAPVPSSEDSTNAQDTVNAWRAFTIRLNVKVTGFQALRTTIQQDQEAFRTSEKGTPHKFIVQPPIYGEQRITNQIDFRARYRLSGTSFESPSTAMASSLNQRSLTAVAQAVHLDAAFVDVLVYIRQSTGGLNDAYRVTIQPIQALLKKNRNDVVAVPKQRKEPIADLLRKATTVFSAKLDGFQVTCVPGGATRLTESPIIKAALSNLRLGIVLLYVPRPSEDTSNESSLLNLPVAGISEDASPSSFTAAGWTSGELSAHYHNRRLVAWEPVVEPWTVHGQFGADLNRLLGQPLSRSIWQIEKKSLTSTERLRDIGRRWVSTFSPDPKSKGSNTIDSSTRGDLLSDLPYNLLTSLGWDILAIALDPSLPGSQKSSKRMLPPGSSPREWLELFGLPSPPETEDTSPIICTVSDTKPLNINVTGALIENLSTYLGLAGGERVRSTVPHWIRNETGLTIRFQEVLALDRQRIGERTTKTILPSGREIPLSLKRTLSQSCDPHRATIQVELGKYDESYGRVTGVGTDDTADTHTHTYCYRTTIAVDTVGVKKIPLLPNTNVVFTDNAAVYCSKLYIIARVSLKGDNKVVSLESPLLVKNTAEIGLGLKITGTSLLWSSGLAAADWQKGKHHTCTIVPIPADILPLLDTRAASLVVSSVSDNGVPSLVFIPPTFSAKSLSRGKISEEEVRLRKPSHGNEPHVSLNVCGLRIGSVDLNSDFATDPKGHVPKLGTDPQQRMILFRPSVVIHNHLPVAIVIWIRRKRMDQPIPKSTTFLAAFSSREKMPNDTHDSVDRKDTWFNMGLIESGSSVSWSGAPSNEQCELRVRFVENDGEEYRQFPSYSSIATVVASSELLLSGSFTSTTKMQIADSSKTMLSLTITVDASNNADVDATSARNLASFASKLTPSPREVSVSVPYWLVDSSGLELEYALNSSLLSTCLLPGQRGPLDSKRVATPATSLLSLGLVEPLENEGALKSASTSSFVILMIGDKGKPNLKIRRRPAHTSEDDNGEENPWSRTIELGSAYSDINVKTLTLRSQTISAPKRFGGKHGTKIIHIFSKIEIVNELGRDIELVMSRGKERPTLVAGDGQPTPFHCGKQGKVKFRPTEFGWKWSGSLELREERKDVTLRLVHKLRGQVILVTVDFFIGGKSVGDRLIFRSASHPPFRIENHTMHALRYFQGYSADVGISSQESTLLAFQSVEFAWDEPDADSNRNEQEDSSLLFTLEVVDLQFSADESEGPSRVIGRMELENIAPGTDIHFSRFSHLPGVAGKVVADGPTKVLHIIDTSLPKWEGKETSNNNELELGGLVNLDKAISVPCWINVRMNHGIGISFVDWTPQELVYVRFDGIRFERSISFTHESVSFSVGTISIDNQLWVTPYPVMLHIDKRTGRRMHPAVAISCRRPLKDQGGLAMLDTLELSIEPISLQVDGYLVELLEEAYRIAGQTMLKVELNDAQSIDSLEDEIKSLLALRSHPRLKETKPYASVLAENFTESGAWATKSIGKIRLGSSIHYRVIGAPGEKPPSTQLAPKSRRRAYINRTDISALKAEISWAGPLPLPRNLSNLSRSLLSSVRSVLTFESVPVSIGAFSREHTYSDDIVDASKHHYKSYLRPGAILGMLAALPFRAPVSVVKAIIYTSNEFFAEFLDSLADWNNRRALACLRVAPRELLPLYASKQSTNCIVGASWPYIITVGRGSVAISRFFHFWTTIFSTWASKHRYAGIRNAGDQLAIRRRNPRLFAHINGQDLLVEYVEGASAGKALLSRVRRGQHLGEGYVYHTENALLETNVPGESEKSLPDGTRTLILMVSIERILVLNSDRGVNFCEVLWEVTFSNLVNLEIQACDDPTLEMIQIWYLTDTTHSTGNREDLLTRLAHAVTTDAGFGMAGLRCKTVFVPRGSELRNKMASFHSNSDNSFKRTTYRKGRMV